MINRYTNSTAGQYAVGLDFSTFPINAGETLVASNAVGSLSVTVKDSTGTDVTAAVIEGTPWIGATQVRWLLKRGVAAGWYTIHVLAPTSDDELLPASKALEVTP